MLAVAAAPAEAATVAAAPAEATVAVAWGPGDPGHGVQDVAWVSESVVFSGCLEGGPKVKKRGGLGGGRRGGRGAVGGGGSCGHPPPAAYITSAGLCLCSTCAVFGFAVHLQHLHLQYLHRHLHYLQLLHCSMDSVLHCCSCSAVWNAAKETPGIVKSEGDARNCRRWRGLGTAGAEKISTSSFFIIPQHARLPGGAPGVPVAGSSSRSSTRRGSSCCRSACRGNSCRCNGSIAVAWSSGDPGH